MTAPRFEPAPGAPGPIVQGFAGTLFRVDGKTYRGLLLTPEGAAEWDAPALADLTTAHVEAALAAKPEFLLLGTGPAQGFPPRAFVAALDEMGVGVEAMDSRAAARTWNMLRAEGRGIAAVLLPL